MRMCTAMDLNFQNISGHARFIRCAIVRQPCAMSGTAIMFNGNNNNLPSSAATLAASVGAVRNNTASSSDVPKKGVKRERQDSEDSRLFPVASPQPPPPKPVPRLPAGSAGQVPQLNNGPKISSTLPERTPVSVPAVVEDGRETPPIDYESVRGRFGWETLGKMHIPFLLRQDDKYTSVRIIEKQLLKKFLSALPKDVYSCTYIKSYFITEIEAKLLNEINFYHCESGFGREPFTTSDLVVKLGDAKQFYEFLETCYIKLCEPTNSNNVDKCGFIKLNGIIVPYITRNQVKYVPLSFFDQDTDSLKMKTEKLEPWELSYIKFCCKVAALQTDFSVDDKSSVISLDDVKKISASLLIEEWWPTQSKPSAPSPNNVDHNSWVSAGSVHSVSSPSVRKQENKHAQNGNHITPTYGTNRVVGNALQPSVQNNTLQYPSLQTNNNSSQSYAYNGQWWGSYPNSGVSGGNVPRMQTPGHIYPSSGSTVVTNSSTVNSIARHNVPSLHNQNKTLIGSQMSGSSGPISKQPPSLIRAPAPTSLASSLSSYGDNSVRNIVSNVPNMLHPANQQLGQQRATQPSTTQQPGQQRVAQPSINQQPAISNVNRNMRDYLPHHQQQPQQLKPNSTSPQQEVPQQACSASPSPLVIDLTDHQTVPSGPNPIKPQYVYVEGKMLPSVDGGRGKRMVTVGHVATDLFPGVSAQTLLDGLKLVLRVQLQQANSSQLTALNDPLHRTGTTDFLEMLVAVEDLMQFMPQLKYMYSSRPESS